MNSRTQRVFNGWLHLTADERRELESEIHRYKNGGEAIQRSLKEASESHVTKMHTGPLSSTCPCCGR